MYKLKFLFLILFAVAFQRKSYGQEVYIPLENLKTSWKVYYGFNITNKILVSKNDTITSDEDTSIYSLKRNSDTVYALKINCKCCSPYFKLIINSHRNKQKLECFLTEVSPTPYLKLGYIDNDTVQNKDFHVLTKGGLRAFCRIGLGYKNDLNKYTQLQITSYDAVLLSGKDTLYFNSIARRPDELDLKKINSLVTKNSKKTLELIIKSVRVRSNVGREVRVNSIYVLIKPN